MMEQPTDSSPVPFLWRLLVDKWHQGRGIGWRVLDIVADQARAWSSTALFVSWVEGYGSPGPFYKRYGFGPTGEMEDDEVVARLQL